MHANDKENLITRFFAHNWCCHDRGTHVSLTIKDPAFVLTCVLPVLASSGSRVLEKKVNETQVSKTEFIFSSYEVNSAETLAVSQLCLI